MFVFIAGRCTDVRLFTCEVTGSFMYLLVWHGPQQHIGSLILPLPCIVSSNNQVWAISDYRRSRASKVDMTTFLPQYSLIFQFLHLL